MSDPILRKLTVVTPFFNESEAIPSYFNQMMPLLESLDCKWEIVCVDDGSRDDTYALLKQWYLRDQRIRIIRFTRNFGKDPAISAGFDHATGDAVVAMDADLQDPPEILPKLIQEWKRGADVVCARRRLRRDDSGLKRFTSRWFYRLFNAISNLQIPEDVGDYQLLDRRVVENLRRFPERRRFMRGIFAFLGYKRAFVDFERPGRAAGKTKWNYWKLWNFALDGITSFSSAPLRIWTYLGTFTCLSGFLFASILIARALVFGAGIPGNAALTTLVLFLGGINMVALGTIGEYIGRIYEEVKARPLYLIDEVLGHQETKEGSPE